MNVEIKPLVWSSCDDDWGGTYWFAPTPFGVIEAFVETGGKWTIGWLGRTRVAWETVEDAKSAAQDWYQDRVMMCLEVPDEG